MRFKCIDCKRMFCPREGTRCLPCSARRNDRLSKNKKIGVASSSNDQRRYHAWDELVAMLFDVSDISAARSMLLAASNAEIECLREKLKASGALDDELIAGTCRDLAARFDDELKKIGLHDKSDEMLGAPASAAVALAAADPQAKA